MQSFFRFVDSEDAVPFNPNLLSYLSLSRRVNQSIYFLPFDHSRVSAQFLFSDNHKNGLQSFRLGANWTLPQKKEAPLRIGDEWGFQVSENGLSAQYRRSQPARDEYKNEKMATHDTSSEPLLYCNVKTPPYPHLLLNGRLLDSKYASLGGSLAVKRNFPLEFVIHPVFKYKGKDRASIELYSSQGSIPTVLFMALGKFTPRFKAGFELGWSGASVSNAGFSVNYARTLNEKTESKLDWTLRQTYLGQTDLFLLNQINRRLLTSGHFSYNSTNFSSKYGLGVIWNLMDDEAKSTPSSSQSQIKASTVGVRWSSEKGWGVRWNADFGEIGSGGVSLGGLSLNGVKAVDDMKIGIHFKSSF